MRDRECGQVYIKKKEHNNVGKDKEQDCYHCPEGRRLRLAGTEKKTGNKRYQIINKAFCINCQHCAICTKGEVGRRIVRLHN
jgi:hypothetical protein